MAEVTAARVFDGARVIRVAGVLGGVGAAVFAVGVAQDPRRALLAYLAAWAAAVIAAVGGLAVLLIGYAANARWPATVRRLCEAVAAALVPLLVLAVPLVVGARFVWPWIEPAPALAAVIAPRRAWLDPAFAAGRAAVYFVVWIGAAELFRAWGRRRDAAPAVPATANTDALDRERGVASALLAPVGLALTFAAVDALMSLDPTWWSSAYGLYVTTGALGSGLAIVILLAARAQARGALPLVGSHFSALGRLLLAFVALWGYLAYFQAFLIQIADLPEEVTFYAARGHGAVRVVTAVLVVLHLGLPLPLLLARRAKHRPRYVGAIAGALLVAHVVDVWWLVVPSLGGDVGPGWIDLAALAAVGGLTVAATAWRVRGQAIVPVGDPYLATGLAYRTPT